MLLGASGSGKSTLLNIIGGLDTPSSGEVFYLDRNLSRAGDQRTVVIGHRSGSEAEVLKGLEAGEMLVRHPSNQLADGARVSVRDN